MTIPFPQFSIRNIFSDQTNAFTEFGRKLFDASNYDDTLKVLGKKDGIIETGVKGRTLSAKEFNDEVLKRGIDTNATMRSDFIGMNLNHEKMLAKGDKNGLWKMYRNMMTNFASKAENFTKVQVAIAYMKKFGKNYDDVAKLMDDATQSAFKATYKYGTGGIGLTPFERDVMKRIVPFYTFFRQNSSAQLRRMFEQPARQRAVLSTAEKLMQPVEGEEIPKEYKNLMPEVYKKTVSEVSGYDEKTGELVVSTLRSFLPQEDANWLFKLIGGDIEPTMTETIGRLQPILKTGLELAFNKDMFMGTPLEGTTITAEGRKKYPYEKLNPVVAMIVDQLPEKIKDKIGFEKITKGDRTYFKMNAKWQKRLIQLPTNVFPASRLLSLAGQQLETGKRGDLLSLQNLLGLTGIKIKRMDARELLLRNLGSDVGAMNEMLRRNAWRYKYPQGILNPQGQQTNALNMLQQQ
jgi:hypothetical protein